MYENYEKILFERRGAILVVTMNNPPTNPADSRLHFELSTLFRDIERDDETKVVVLTGAGDAFSAGGDIKDIAERAETRNYAPWVKGNWQARRIFYDMLDFPKPIIARVNGAAIGFGATLALLCDIVVAIEDAKIADTHVKIGLVAGDGGALIWPQLVGFVRAKEYLLTGRTMTGTDAAKMGLINYAVPRAELDAKVFELAAEIAALPAHAVSLSKVAVNLTLRQQFSGLMEAHLGLETYTHLGSDHVDAVKAIRDQAASRKPKS